MLTAVPEKFHGRLCDHHLPALRATCCSHVRVSCQVVFLLRIACEVRTKIRGARSHRCEMEKTLNVAQRELDELKLDQMFKTRKKLLNEDGLHPLHDLGAWVIDRGPVNGRRH